MPAFKEWSKGGCAAVSVRAVSVGGCVTGNESGKTYSGQVGARAGENGYPIAEHVEETYTGVLTVKDAARFVRRKLADAEAALNAAMNEAVRRMYYPNQD